MKQQKIETIQHILEEKDIKTLKRVLNYTIHRIREHGKGLKQGLDLEEINRLREELGF